MNNDLEQFSEERLKQVEASGLWSRLSHAESQALARIALSAKQAKPVGHFSRVNGDGIWFEQWTDKLDVPLYTTPQPAHTEQAVPYGWKLVPIEMTDDIGEAIAKHARCCGGIALDIYEAALAAAPKPESE